MNLKHSHKFRTMLAALCAASAVLSHASAQEIRLPLRALNLTLTADVNSVTGVGSVYAYDLTVANSGAQPVEFTLIDALPPALDFNGQAQVTAVGDYTTAPAPSVAPNVEAFTLRGTLGAGARLSIRLPVKLVACPTEPVSTLIGAERIVLNSATVESSTGKMVVSHAFLPPGCNTNPAPNPTPVIPAPIPPPTLPVPIPPPTITIPAPIPPPTFPVTIPPLTITIPAPILPPWISPTRRHTIKISNGVAEQRQLVVMIGDAVEIVNTDGEARTFLLRRDQFSGPRAADAASAQAGQETFVVQPGGSHTVEVTDARSLTIYDVRTGAESMSIRTAKMTYLPLATR